MANRYFVDTIKENYAQITGSDAMHLAKVLRVKVGDTLWLCDGAGYDYFVQVEHIHTKQIDCKVLDRCESVGEPHLQISLYVALGKGDKMDWVVQKSVELGAVSLAPFLSSRCVVRPKTDKQDRFLRIATEAAKQSARGKIPTVLPLFSFDAMLEHARQNECLLLLHPGGKTNLASCLPNLRSLALITGPEGGFTNEEIAAAEKSGCHIAGLGSRILRCETAPIAALAAIMALAGEW